MSVELQFGDISVDVFRKSIKNVHLSVYPPTGRVRISIPQRMNLDTVRVFVISKLGWIKKQQKFLLTQDRETAREFLERESHYLWGKRYLLEIIEDNQSPSVEKKHRHLALSVRPQSSESKRREVIEDWYRVQLKNAIVPLIEKWEKVMDVSVSSFQVRKMKTRWGSSISETSRIIFNLELAKKPVDCLEYIVVHELTHLLESTHNNRFVSLMDQFLPQWKNHRNVLNGLPVSHRDWKY